MSVCLSCVPLTRERLGIQSPKLASSFPFHVKFAGCSFEVKGERSRSQTCIMLVQEMCNNTRKDGRTKFKLGVRRQPWEINIRKQKVTFQGQFKVTRSTYFCLHVVSSRLLTQERNERKFKFSTQVVSRNILCVWRSQRWRSHKMSHTQTVGTPSNLPATHIENVHIWNVRGHEVIISYYRQMR